jgi:hypothetical protein
MSDTEVAYILSEVVRVLDSNKVWNGKQYEYHSISPAKYLELKSRVELELDKLNLEI